MISNTIAKKTASTILKQLGNLSMVNGKNILYGFDDDMNRFVQFSFSGNRRMNKCKIIYDYQRDTYTLELGRIAKYEYRKTYSIDDLFGSDLMEIFTKQTGLDLRL